MTLSLRLNYKFNLINANVGNWVLYPSSSSVPSCVMCYYKVLVLRIYGRCGSIFIQLYICSNMSTFMLSYSFKIQVYIFSYKCRSLIMIAIFVKDKGVQYVILLRRYEYLRFQLHISE